MQSEASNRVYRFGVYEADLQEGTLTKSGVRIRLQDQPFLILGLLLERSGQVVSREEIRQRLWSEDTFVEFDDGLNTAVRKLRTALGDSADNPRFLETVPRRGYRFVAPVSLRSEPVVARAGEKDREIQYQREAFESSRVSTAVGDETGTNRDPRFVSERDVEPSNSGLSAPENALKLSPLRSGGLIASARRMTVMLVLVAIIAGLALSIAYSRRKRAQKAKLTAQDTIVIADFSNSTGDKAFDNTLKQALFIALRESPFLEVLPESKVGKTLKMMTLDEATPLTPAVAREVCQRAGSKAYITGAIGILGAEYVLGLRAVDCQTGDVVARQQVTVGGKGKVIDALGEAAAKLRREMGESLATVRKFDTPLAQATTSSLEALRLYSEANSIQRRKGDAASVALYRQVVELDPNFALAHDSLALVYANLAEYGLEREGATRAFALRDRVSEVEKYSISAHYYGTVTGEMEKANQVLEQWALDYPRDSNPPDRLQLNYNLVGNYDKAVAESANAVRLSPGNPAHYSNLIANCAASYRLDQAETAYEQALTLKLDNPILHVNRYGIAFLEGDAPEMERQLAFVKGKPGIEDLMLSVQSDTEAYFGHFNAARKLSLHAAELAKRNDKQETAAEWLLNSAMRDAEVGNRAQALESIRSAASLASSPGLEILTALASARSGDSTQVSTMAEELHRESPLNSLLNGYWLPTIRAAVELSNNRPDDSIAALQAAFAYELGEPNPQVQIGGTLYPAYLRGEAYLKKGNGQLAAVEFHKLIDHRGVVQNFVLGTLAHLQLGRAYSMAGDMGQARTAYRDFFAIWKDADPDIPILKEAKLEYAKLN
jgi:eukaryotic-like serine/threonine-protein kinase